MCPHAVVLAGGGAGGGSGGAGAGSGGGGSGGGPGGGGSGAGGGSPGAASGSPDGNKYKRAAPTGEPVDAATGRVYTLPAVDLELSGPLPLRLVRRYSSTAHKRDVGLGWGWTHTLGWHGEVLGARIRIWTDTGTWVDIPKPEPGATMRGCFGWQLTDHGESIALDMGEGLTRRFAIDGRTLRLIELRDQHGNRIVIQHGTSELSVTDAVGRRIRMRRDEDGRIVALEAFELTVDPGRWVSFARYRYDATGHLVEVQDADGHRWQFEYDRRHLTLHVDRAGFATHYRYDRHGRCIRTWGDYLDRPDTSIDATVPTVLRNGAPAKGVHDACIEYLPDGFREVFTASSRKTYHVNDAGLVEMSTDQGRIETTTYDDYRRVVEESDPAGAKTFYERDDLGRVVAVTDARGRTTKVERDEKGRVVRVEHPTGLATRIDRDVRGRPATVHHPDESAVTYRYDERGQVVERTTANGVRQVVTRDAHGNIVAAGVGNRLWTYRYDYFGRLLQQTDPMGATSTFSYSARGDLLSVTNADGTGAHFERDGEGRLVRRTEANGATERLEWGGFHRLVRTVDPLGRSISLRYDREGALTTVVNQVGDEHRFFFDEHGNVSRQVAFDGRTTSYRYDERGDQTLIVGPDDARHELTYNAVGELIERAFDGAMRERFTYDPAGRIASLEADAIAITFGRDMRGQIVEQRCHADDRDVTVTTERDAGGRTLSRRTSEGHLLRIDRPGPDDEHWDVDGSIVQRRFDALGRETQRVLPQGGVLHLQHDARGRLVEQQLCDAGGTVRHSRRYHFDADRLAGFDEGEGSSTRLERDAAGRLTGVLRAGRPEERYSWTATDCLLENGTKRHYDRGNRIVRRADREYEYDRAGRLSAKVTPDARWTYRYDAKGQLVEVQRDRDLLVRMGYDPIGRRVRKAVFRREGTEWGCMRRVRFTWDHHSLVHEHTEDLETGRSSRRDYVYDTSSHIVLMHIDHGSDGSVERRHYISDIIGTPILLVDDHGSVVTRLEYSTWGKVLDGAAAAATSFRFQGQYADEETGLHYNWRRFYDPETGSFITPDPRGIVPDLNEYQRGRDPFVDIDAFGEAAEQLVPNPNLSRAQRKDLRDAARKAYADDKAAKAVGDAIKTPKKASECEAAASEAKTLGGGNKVSISPSWDMLNEQERPVLKRFDIDTGEPATWDNHYVNTKDGAIIDHDQGVKFASKQDYIDAMFEPDTGPNGDKPPREIDTQVMVGDW